MESAWYVVKVLPGKERSLNEQFNKDIGFDDILLLLWYKNKLKQQQR